MKSKQLKAEQMLNKTCSQEKNWNKSNQNYMFATLYTSYHLPRMYGQWDSDHC